MPHSSLRKRGGEKEENYRQRFSRVRRKVADFLRNYITSHGDELAQIVDELKAYGLTIDGEKLKNVPRGYNPEHPQAAFLKYKSWYLEDSVDDAIVRDGPRLLERAEERFLLIKPFNAYLNKALEDWKMPQRPSK